ncbi:MAG: ribosome small subunit-dependent GTPase A [Actinomycetota bacterium]
MPTLAEFGWDQHFQNLLDAGAPPGSIPGRVSAQHRGAYVLFSEVGEMIGELTGRLKRDAANKAELPSVGDWVAFHPSPNTGRSQIVYVLPRRTRFARKEAGRMVQTSRRVKGTIHEQIIAANIDFLFIVTALNNEFKVRRLERYLPMAIEGGVTPVVLLTKSDLCDDPQPTIEQVRSVAPLLEVHVTSVVTGKGIDELAAYFKDHRTTALVGSSGVGKSTLINHLLGEDALAVRETRIDDRGRHTTTWRELLVLPNGGLIIDTPGLRELQLWGADDAVGETFPDLEEVAANCRFRDCAHDREPDCALKAAVEAGTVDRGRFNSYMKLRHELAALKTRSDYRSAVADKRHSPR